MRNECTSRFNCIVDLHEQESFNFLTWWVTGAYPECFKCEPGVVKCHWLLPILNMLT